MMEMEGTGILLFSPRHCPDSSWARHSPRAEVPKPWGLYHQGAQAIQMVLGLTKVRVSPASQPAV